MKQVEIRTCETCQGEYFVLDGVRHYEYTEAPQVELALSRDLHRAVRQRSGALVGDDKAVSETIGAAHDHGRALATAGPTALEIDPCLLEEGDRDHEGGHGRPALRTRWSRSRGRRSVVR